MVRMKSFVLLTLTLLNTTTNPEFLRNDQPCMPFDACQSILVIVKFAHHILVFFHNACIFWRCKDSLPAFAKSPRQDPPCKVLQPFRG